MDEEAATARPPPRMTPTGGRTDDATASFALVAIAHKRMTRNDDAYEVADAQSAQSGLSGASATSAPLIFPTRRARRLRVGSRTVFRFVVAAAVFTASLSASPAQALTFTGEIVGTATHATFESFWNFFDPGETWTLIYSYESDVVDGS